MHKIWFLTPAGLLGFAVKMSALVTKAWWKAGCGCPPCPFCG